MTTSTRKMRASATVAAAALSLLAIPGLARAGDQDAVTAEALFEAGRSAVQRGDYATACPKFAESQRLDPAPGTLLNLADCEEHLGHLAAAWDAWHEAIHMLPTGDDRLGPARLRAQALDRRIPRLIVKLAPGAPGDARVHRDEVALGPASLGVPLPVDPGAHTVRVESDGHAPATTTLTLAEGETKTADVSAGAPLPPPAPAPSPAIASAPAPSLAPSFAPPAALPPSPAAGREQPADHPGLRTAGWVLGAVGVAGLAAGATTGILAFSKKGTVQDHCPAGKGCDTTGYDAARSGHTMAIVSDVTFAAGAVLVAAGAWLVLTHPRAAAAPRTGLVLLPSPAGASLALRRSF